MENCSIETLAIRAAIKQMFDHGWMNICTIDMCLKTAGLQPPAREYQILKTLHCVHFNQMPPELMRQIPGLLLTLFDRGVDVRVMNEIFAKWEKALPAPATTQ